MSERGKVRKRVSIFLGSFVDRMVNRRRYSGMFFYKDNIIILKKIEKRENFFMVY